MFYHSVRAIQPEQPGEPGEGEGQEGEGPDRQAGRGQHHPAAATGGAHRAQRTRQVAHWFVMTGTGGTCQCRSLHGFFKTTTRHLKAQVAQQRDRGLSDVGSMRLG